MALKLGGLHESTIMILGRWKSMAVFDYIRKQVAEFSNDVSDTMFSNGTFFTTPEFRQPAPQLPFSSREMIDGGIDWKVAEPLCLTSAPEEVDGERRRLGESVRISSYPAICSL